SHCALLEHVALQLCVASLHKEPLHASGPGTQTLPTHCSVPLQNMPSLQSAAPLQGDVPNNGLTHSGWSTNGLRLCWLANTTSLRRRSKSSTGSSSFHNSKSDRSPITVPPLVISEGLSVRRRSPVPPSPPPPA